MFSHSAKSKSLMVSAPFLVAGLVISVLTDLPGTSKLIVVAVSLVVGLLAFVASCHYEASSSSGFQISGKFKVKAAELVFTINELGKSQRPETSEKVTELFDEALALDRSEQYERAAKLYGAAFKKDARFWPAKVNEALCYQLTGDFKTALDIYESIIDDCDVPRYRRQAFGNSADILEQVAENSEPGEEVDRLSAIVHERYLLAYNAERTFVSTMNYWESCVKRGLVEAAQKLIEEMRTFPEFKQCTDQINGLLASKA